MKKIFTTAIEINIANKLPIIDEAHLDEQKHLWSVMKFAHDQGLIPELCEFILEHPGYNLDRVEIEFFKNHNLNNIP